MAGVIAGLLGCVFGILGILTIAIVFVPLAALCALVGFLRGVIGGSAVGAAVSAIAGILAVVGFLSSPTLMLMTAVPAIMMIARAPDTTPPALSAPIEQTAPAVAVALPSPQVNQATERPEVSAFDSGVSDRHAWDAWVNDTGGDFRAGIEFWAEHRSDHPPPSCARSNSETGTQWVEGCEEARARLTPYDRMRKSSTEYRQGWNSIP